MRRTITGVGPVVLLVIAGLVGLTNRPTAGMAGPAVGQQVNLSSLAPFAIRFTPLPAVQSSITQNQAVSVALQNSYATRDSSGQLLAGVQVNAQYGLYSKRQVYGGATGVRSTDSALPKRACVDCHLYGRWRRIPEARSSGPIGTIAQCYRRKEGTQQRVEGGTEAARVQRVKA